MEVSHKLWHSHYLYLISLGNPNLLLCARTVVLVAEKEEVPSGMRVLNINCIYDQ